jgi:hypothetical protein
MAAFEAGRLRLVGEAGHDPAFVSNFIEGATVQSRSMVARVVRTRSPVFVESKAEMFRLTPDERDVVEGSGMKAWAFLPLVATGHVIGAFTIAFVRPTRLSDADRTLLIAVSGLVAHALERARLFDVEHTRAHELQRSLLPEALPSLPAADVAVRYVPANHDAEVGGDWYDAIPLSADRVALVVGDVMGHGITEAATMGMIRTTVRTLAELELPPAEVLARLNALVPELGDASYATCLYAVFDPVARTCTICRAGHPPPIIVHPDGTVRRLELDADPPLGAAQPPFETHTVQLPDESLLVLFTDGFLDSARNDVEQGLRRMARIFEGDVARRQFAVEDRTGSQLGLEELCDTVVRTMLPDRDRMSDDAALLIAHTYGTPTFEVAFEELDDEPTAARAARSYARERLARWGLEGIEGETELIVSELVGNAIRHAKGPIRLRLIHSTSLICEVYDGSLTTPHIRRATENDEGGRGLQLVAAVAQRWGARYLDDGKCIWAEQSLS